METHQCTLATFDSYISLVPFYTLKKKIQYTFSDLNSNI